MFDISTEVKLIIKLIVTLADYAKKFVDKSLEFAQKNKRNAIPDRQLGITTISITQDIVKDLLVKERSIPEFVNHGIFVWKVVKGTPAHK